MASIRKLNGKWIAQVCKAGHPRVSKFFNSKSLASSWLVDKLTHEKVYNYISLFWKNIINESNMCNIMK